MKEAFVNNSINYLIKNNACSKEQVKVFRYTLESLYSLFTKFSVVILISLLLGTFKITLITFFLYCILRGFAFGIHATKNIYCWIITLTTYAVVPLIIKYVMIPKNVLIVANVIGILALLLWAPADTPARPLLNKRKRFANKLISVSYCILIDILAIVFNNYELFYIMSFVIVIETICILPLTYKLFHIPYHNYENYKK